MNEHHAPLAVLDWGFLSTQGDAAFDASITAGIFDMYGPGARAVDDELIDLLVSNNGFSRQRLLLYRAIYGIMTANVYDPTGQDGHYAWCVRMLDREDITEALYASSDKF